MKKYDISEINEIQPKVGERFTIVYNGNEFEFKPFYYEDDVCLEVDMVAGYNVYYDGDYIRNYNDPELEEEHLESLFSEVERNIINPRKNKGKIKEIEQIAVDARQRLVDVINNNLKGKKKQIGINVSFCNDWDEDRYTEANVLAIRKNRKGEIVVHYECDGEEYEDDIMLYSFDKIYKIAMAVVSKC